MTVSNLQIMRTLIAKDWRLFRGPKWALIIPGGGCTAIALIYGFAWAASGIESPSLTACGLLVCSSIVAACLACPVACALGGMAFATERADHTCDFVALLPVTRRQIIFSKLLAGGSMLLGFAAANVLVAAICLLVIFAWTRDDPIPNYHWLDISQAIALWIGCAVSLFGVGWACSTFIKSGAISATISFAITAMAIGFPLLHMDDSYDRFRVEPVVAAGIGMLLGLSGLIGGTAYYLRRIAP